MQCYIYFAKKETKQQKFAVSAIKMAIKVKNMVFFSQSRKKRIFEMHTIIILWKVLNTVYNFFLWNALVKEMLTIFFKNIIVYIYWLALLFSGFLNIINLTLNLLLKSFVKFLTRHWLVLNRLLFLSHYALVKLAIIAYQHGKIALMHKRVDSA